MGGQGGEQLVEPLVRDRPWNTLGRLGLIRCRTPWPPPGLHRVVVRVKLLTGNTPASRERVDQRTPMLHPVMLIERMNHGACVPPGRNRVGLGGMGLSRD